MTSSRLSLLLCPLLCLVACSSPDSSETTPDAAGSDAAPITVDAPLDAPACTTDGRVYVAERQGSAVAISAFDEPVVGGSEIADVTCGADATGLGVLTSGDIFVGLANGGIARVTSTACTSLTITPALTGELALVGRGSELLALERETGTLWKVDPATGAATSLSTIPGAHAESSLVGGAAEVMVYIPAGLGGTGALIPIDASGQPGTARTVTGASSYQAQAAWVSVVGDADKLWMTVAGYFGAGGSPRTIWMPFQNDALNSASVEYYASTVALTAATCP